MGLKQQLWYISPDNQQLLIKEDKCDKYDYLIAAGCGVVGGLVDVFLVGSPADSSLLAWTDEQVNKVVITFSKLMGWKPRAGNENKIKDAIGFLQNRFKVNYDQATRASASEVFGILPTNHHMKSLAHSPDIIGLFFSVLDQFRSTSTFLSNGRLITMDTNTFELRGGNFIAKLFCGVANWFGHLMSDVAGSYTSSGRGSGLVMPFFELFNLFELGNFNTGKERGTFADVATKAFEQGYDFRFGIVQSIPVLISDLSIRLIWALRRKFQFKKPLKDCIPLNVHPDLRIMLLIGNGALCVVDGIDAGVAAATTTAAAPVTFALKFNYTAWLRLVKLSIKEICIRVGLNVDLEEYLESFKRVNEAIETYLNELETIDIDQFRKETEIYNSFSQKLQNTTDEVKMNQLLLESMRESGITLPWEGDFNDFMSNKNNKLVFK